MSCVVSPPRFPSALMSLQISQAIAQLPSGPALGGAVFCLPAPRTRPGSPCPWPFLLPLALCSPAGLSQRQQCEMAGVNSCLGGRGHFRPFFVRGQGLGSPPGRELVGERSALLSLRGHCVGRRGRGRPACRPGAGFPSSSTPSMLLLKDTLNQATRE